MSDERPIVFQYQPSLDGLRAVAVTLVVLFHAGLPWLTGGYLGVSVFFTLSGFLITSLLVAEHRSSGGISLSAFYARRARRLLPASLLCVALVVLAHAAGYPGLQDNIGNIGLMLQAESAGLLPPGVGTAAADAYRDLRHWQHQARLDEIAGRDDSGQLHRQRDDILRLWQAVFTMN